ncbi:MAG: type II 3-dehydroquinate dehydratase [Candidatus Riflebacteria bacterium]|nr:type II 3-dehydroquinate dehydratase [Candidatus Riflebacteria bacterium]
MKKLRKVLVMNGPNLNMIGTRETNIYGDTPVEVLEETLKTKGLEMGIEVDCFQSNHEGDLIDRIQRIDDEIGMIINPGGLSHTSICLRDAIKNLKIPVIEVHISNIFGREKFRRQTLTGAVCYGLISGLGLSGYLLALEYLSCSTFVNKTPSVQE